jgi:putative aminopeptidase FrvX
MIENIDFLKRVLSIPTHSFQEDKMIEFLTDYLLEKKYDFHIDELGNIYVTKGQISEGEFYPCVVAHTDTVHKIDTINIREEYLKDSKGKDSFSLKAYNDNGDPTGIGGDDKCGVFACLQLLEEFDVLKAAFFVSEEVGCIGSKEADPRFFENVGYAIQFDAPDDYMVTEYCFGVKLFESDSDFHSSAREVLNENMLSAPKFMQHPYTDVWQLKKKFDFSCINFSVGYHNYHTRNEYVVVEDVYNGIKTGKELIESLGCEKYKYSPNPKSNRFMIFD